MPKPSDNLVKVTVRLVHGDVEVLSSFYPAAGYNKVIRAIIHRHVKHLLKKEATIERMLNEGELEEELEDALKIQQPQP